MEECSSFSTSSPTCAVTCGFDLSHSDWCKMEFQSQFDLHLGILQNVRETWEVRDSQDSKGRTLDEMPNIREGELIESNSNKKIGHQMREWVAIPQPKLCPIIVPVWKNYRDGNEEEREEKVQQQDQRGIQLKGCSKALYYYWGYGALTKEKKMDLAWPYSGRPNKQLKGSEADICTQSMSRSCWALWLN